MDDFTLDLYQEGKIDCELGREALCDNDEYLSGYGDAYVAQEQQTALTSEPMEY